MRILGLLLVALAAAIIWWFGIRAPLGAVIFTLAPGVLEMAQAGVQRHLSPGLWNTIALPVLEWPGWLVPVVLGVLMLVFGPGRRRG